MAAKHNRSKQPVISVTTPFQMGDRGISRQSATRLQVGRRNLLSQFLKGDIASSVPEGSASAPIAAGEPPRFQHEDPKFGNVL